MRREQEIDSFIHLNFQGHLFFSLMAKPRGRSSLHCWISCVGCADEGEFSSTVTMFDAEGRESVQYKGEV